MRTGPVHQAHACVILVAVTLRLRFSAQKADVNPADNIRLYDRIGRLADSTASYVDPALNRLTQLASLREAKRIVEVGGGTGRYAARLMQGVFPSDAQPHRP